MLVKSWTPRIHGLMTERNRAAAAAADDEDELRRRMEDIIEEVTIGWKAEMLMSSGSV